MSLDEVVKKFAKAEQTTEPEQEEEELPKPDISKKTQVEQKRLIQSPRRALLRKGVGNTPN